MGRRWYSTKIPSAEAMTRSKPAWFWDGAEGGDVFKVSLRCGPLEVVTRTRAHCLRRLAVLVRLCVPSHIRHIVHVSLAQLHQSCVAVHFAIAP